MAANKAREKSLEIAGGVIFEYDARDDVLYINSRDETMKTMIMGVSGAEIEVTFFEGYPISKSQKEGDQIQIASHGGACVMHVGGSREETHQLAAILGVKAEEEAAPTPEEMDEIRAEAESYSKKS